LGSRSVDELRCAATAHPDVHRHGRDTVPENGVFGKDDTRASLALVTAVHAATATSVDVRAGYLRADGEWVELGARTVRLERQSDQQATLSIDLARCLADPRRAVGGAGGLGPSPSSPTDACAGPLPVLPALPPDRRYCRSVARRESFWAGDAAAACRQLRWARWWSPCPLGSWVEQSKQKATATSPNCCDLRHSAAISRIASRSSVVASSTL